MSNTRRINEKRAERRGEIFAEGGEPRDLIKNAAELRGYDRRKAELKREAARQAKRDLDVQYAVAIPKNGGGAMRFVATATEILGQSPDQDQQGQTPEDYEELGRAFFEKYNEVVGQPACADFICADSPVEIIDYLINALDEAKGGAE